MDPFLVTCTSSSYRSSVLTLTQILTLIFLSEDLRPLSASAKIIQVSLVMKRKRVANRIQNLFHNLQHIASRTKHEQFDEMVVKCCVFYRLWFLCDVILLIYLRSSSSADRLDSRLAAAGAGNVSSGVV